MSAVIRFDRGTVIVEGPHELVSSAPGVIWDERTACFRAPAFRYRELRQHFAMHKLSDAVGAAMSRCAHGWKRPALRPYQADALGAWLPSRRGILVMPTGSGKTRMALAIMAHLAVPSLVLCPTRMLLSMWAQEIHRWYDGAVGVVGDDTAAVEDVTVMTFEGACRHLDTAGNRFGLVVVDEVHHVGSGMGAEGLEMCAASARLGLTATAQEPGSEALTRLGTLVGPPVYEGSLASLMAGTHLAELTLTRISVSLDAEEAVTYERLTRSLRDLRQQSAHAVPAILWEDFARSLTRSVGGRRALREYREGIALASFPRAKRATLGILLERHRDDRVLVFTSTAEHAHAIARDHLVPVISGDTGRAERDWILRMFAEGKLRAIVSARILNEGLDVPDANVAIVVAGALGAREHGQHVGRILRPAPGKQAFVYELATVHTTDAPTANRREQQTLTAAAS